MPIQGVLVCLLVILTAVIEQAYAQSNPKVTLRSGIFEGLVSTYSNKPIHKYLGIPFAQPPIRFAPPLPLPSTNSTVPKLANKLPPACIQNTASIRTPTSSSESEDCLYLNIYAPADAANATEKKTVMVWLFGGGLQFGSASERTYDGSSFAANQDLILVAPNYRVNVFGFPGPAPGIAKAEQNLGFLDQRMALDWVRENIGTFGGDKDKVTIFGESAGARSVDFLILAPPKSGGVVPFRAGIMESGSSTFSPGGSDGVLGRKRDAMLELLGKEVGCAEKEKLIDCLRAVPVARIKQAASANGFAFGATDDGGRTTVVNAEVARAAHQIANVSLLIGTNADELKQNNGGLSGSTQRSSLELFLNSKFSSDSILKDSIKRAYAVGPEKQYRTEADAIGAITTDMEFTCVTSRESKSSFESGYPTWRYFYNFSRPNPGAAYHASELPYVFGTFRGSDPGQVAVSKAMQTAWATFAKNPTIGPGWSRIGPNMKIGIFTQGGVLEEGGSETIDKNCALFKRYLDSRISNA